MGTYNLLRATLICPRCNKLADTEIELFFGDTRNIDPYSLGDRYRWLAQKAVQNGGRPENGDLDGEGYAECPHCRQGFFVKVLVRNDVIRGVEPDFEKTLYILSPQDAEEMPASVPVQPEKDPKPEAGTGLKPVMRQGTITYNVDWELTHKRKTALLRLAELGVDVYSSVGTNNFRLIVPFNLHPDVYIEIGYLMAQLGDEDFPKGFHHPIAVSYAPTKLFDLRFGQDSPVTADDSLPQGFRYTVTPQKKLKTETGYGGQDRPRVKDLLTPPDLYDLSSLEAKKKEALAVAQDMLDGKKGVIEGARLLVNLRPGVTRDEFDPYFLPFVAIASETDGLPVGEERKLWADYALEKKDKEIRQAEDSFREEALTACRALIAWLADS